MPEGTFRIDKALTNIAVEYANSEYIAGDILKDVPVVQDSGKYFIFASDFKLPPTHRADGAPANMIKIAASTSTYAVTEHALKDVVTDRMMANADNPFDLKADTTRNLVDKIMMRQEYEAQKLLFTTTTWSNNATLTSETSWKYHTTTSVPIQNILSATGQIIKFCGRRPNMAVIGWDGFAGLKENANVYGRIMYVQKAILTPEILASVFDLDALKVGSSAYMNADEGLETTTSQSFIWGSDCLVAFMNPNPGIGSNNRMTAAVTFRVAAKGTPYRVKRWREEDVEGEFIEVQSMFKHQAVATSCAYLFKSVAL